jgi:ABC-type anion transport system duplicated permease subunit
VSENSPVYFASTKTLSSESLLHLWSWILRWAINLNPKLTVASIQSHLVSPLSPHPAPLYFSLLSNKTSVGPCTTFVIRPRECSEPLRLITTYLYYFRNVIKDIRQSGLVIHYFVCIKSQYIAIFIAILKDLARTQLKPGRK